MIPGCQSLWHVKHLHISGNMAFNPCSTAELSFCQGTWWKITAITYSSCGFQDGQRALYSFKTDFAKEKEIAMFLEVRQQNPTLWSRNSSYPTNSNFNVFFIRWPGMKRRLAWVTWHYKCVFIKLSLQVLLLGSCVLVRFFSVFHIFQRYGKCHYFRRVYVFCVLCQQNKLLLTL